MRLYLLRDGWAVCTLGPWKAVCETANALISADHKAPRKMENNANLALAYLGCLAV